MLDFVNSEIDYLSFVKGLFFLFFSGACLLYNIRERQHPFFYPLVWFGVLQAIFAWSHQLSLIFEGEIADGHHYSHVIALISYIGLLLIWPGFILNHRGFVVIGTWIAMLGFGGLLIFIGNIELFEFYAKLTLALASFIAILTIIRYRIRAKIRIPGYIAILVLLATTSLIQSTYGGHISTFRDGEGLLNIFHLSVVFVTTLVIWLDIILNIETDDEEFLPAHRAARRHRVRYSLWLGISLAVILIAGWHGVQTLGENTISSVKARTQAATEVLSNQIRDDIARADLAANILARATNIVDVFNNPGDSHNEVKLILNQLSLVLESSVAFLMLPDGHVPLASNNAKNMTGKNFGFLPYFRESVLYGLTGHDFAVEPNLNDRGYYVSHPILAEDYSLIGVAVVKKLLAQGSREFKKFKNWFLIDPNGVIFISGRKDLLLKSLWNFPQSRKQELIRIGHLGPGPFEAILEQEVENGSEIIFEGRASALSSIDINTEKWKAVVISDFSQDVQMNRLSGIGIMMPICLFILAYFMVAQREAKFEQKMAEDKIKLESMNELLEQQATMDRLTGAFNRHKFETMLQDQIHLSNRYETPFSLLLFDIDHFKYVNDTFGHQAGDEVLRELVNVVRKQLREEDLAVRWGGEEFIVMMPMTSIEGAVITSERLRKKIESHTFPHGKQVTASFGVGQYDGTNKKEFLSAIDEALYYAKENGRNQVKQMEPRSSREEA